MDSIKISLTITLPGAVMFDKETALKEVWKNFVTKRGVEIKKKVLVEDYEKHDKFHFTIASGKDKESFTAFIRKCIPVKQSININEDAYNYYVSKEIPEFSNKYEWTKLSKKQRLEAHLNDIAAGLGGVVSDYFVFED